jgi:signal transduction histidine kinase
MKLLQKTNRAYFLISGTAFAVAGAIIYYVLSIILADQLNEKLRLDIENVKLSIEKENTLPNYFPFIEAKEVKGMPERLTETIDTLIFDTTENEEIPFRQISLICSINDKKYYVAARDTLVEKSDLLATIAIVTGLVFIVLLVSLYFINRKLYINIWQPFYKTLDELKRFSHDKPGFKLTTVTQPDEFKELNETLEKLTQKVISDYQSLKRFTEDASHEIQNPLAVIQLNLEALMQDPDLREDQSEVIKSAYSNTQRISKLTHTLLLLTKIANDQFPEKSYVNLSELVEEKIKLFEDHINAKSMTLICAIDPDCNLDTNYFLAESLINNLIGNAVKHTYTEGILNILLNRNQLEISNTAKPLEELSSKIFDRFYKINKSSDSYGLGLALVKEICTLNRWAVSYEYVNCMHKFTVKF